MNIRASTDNRQNWHHTDDLHAPQGKGDPFAAAMRATRMPMLLTDPNQPDNPIVFVNDAFLDLTGYDREEVMGRNCRFLQGAETDPADVETIRAAIAQRRDISIEILNCRKDGTTFWNALNLSPVSNEQGDLLYFFASLLDVTDRKQQQMELNTQTARFESAVKERTRELERALEAQSFLVHEVDHRVKNNLQIVSSLVLMQRRNIGDPVIRDSLAAVQARIEALSTVHHLLYQADDLRQLSVADLVRDIATSLNASVGRNGVAIHLDLDDVHVSAESATPIALIVNELVTNALKHAFGSDGGTIRVCVKKTNTGLDVEVGDNGRGMASRKADSFGMRLIEALARQLHSRVEWDRAGPGTSARISIESEKISESADGLRQSVERADR